MDPATHRQRARSRSLEWRLPLLISGLLLCVVTVFAAMVYVQVRRVLLRASEARARGAAQQLSGMLAESVQQLAAGTRRLAGDSAVRRFTMAPNETGARAVQRLIAPVRAAQPQLASVEVRAPDGRRLLLIGSEPMPAPAWRAPASDASAGADVRLGAMMAHGDTVAYTVSAPVLGAGGDTTGWLVEHRRLASSRTAGTLRALIGSDAQFLIGNRDGSLWSDLAHRATGPALDRARPGALVRDTADGVARLGAAVGIAGAPWMVWVSMPVSRLTAPARDLLRRMLAGALLVLAAGALGGWLLSRRITGPLQNVMRAAEGISAGDYSRRVAPGGAEEVDRLATSFNIMAAQVEEQRHALEARVAERTRELSDALARLHETQETLVRKEKLATLGQLAGGVGHELRNPLGVMTNAVHYLGLVLRDAPPVVGEYLGILRTQIGLAERIVGDLLDSARVRPPQREPVTAARLVSDQLERLGPTNGVDVCLDLPADLPHVSVDRMQIGQVLLNLLTNAVQAMGDRGGTLTVRARARGADELEVQVADTGPGIAAEHVEHIFEPLFTTKARGLGLGLSVARTLARANGGDLTAESRPGAGATFTLTMPTLAGGMA
ncbi:MAG TPA: ATP-binding protein [Gemmatimonadaceae bacterium]|nr:ATP-binding protein [Gemmatimonadaceae bacterium]